MPRKPEIATRIAATIRRYQIKHPETAGKGKEIPGRVHTDKRAELHGKISNLIKEVHPLWKFVFETRLKEASLASMFSSRHEKAFKAIEKFALEQNNGNQKDAIDYLERASMDLIEMNNSFRKIIAENPYFKRTAKRQKVNFDEYRTETVHTVSNFLTPIMGNLQVLLINMRKRR